MPSVQRCRHGWQKAWRQGVTTGSCSGRRRSRGVDARPPAGHAPARACKTASCPSNPSPGHHEQLPAAGALVVLDVIAADWEARQCGRRGRKSILASGGRPARRPELQPPPTHGRPSFRAILVSGAVGRLGVEARWQAAPGALPRDCQAVKSDPKRECGSHRPAAYRAPVEPPVRTQCSRTERKEAASSDSERTHCYSGALECPCGQRTRLQAPRCRKLWCRVSGVQQSVEYTKEVG